MLNRLLTIHSLVFLVVAFTIPSSAGAEKPESPQGIEAPSAYLESIESPGDSGGVEDADAAAAAELAAENQKSKDSKKD